MISGYVTKSNSRAKKILQSTLQEEQRETEEKVGRQQPGLDWLDPQHLPEGSRKSNEMRGAVRRPRTTWLMNTEIK